MNAARLKTIIKMYFVGYLPGCVYNVLFAGQLCDLCREGRKKVESRTDRAATSDLRDEDEKNGANFINCCCEIYWLILLLYL